MIDSLLKARLQAVADRQRQLQLWSKLAACWTIAAIVGLGLIALQRQGGWTSMLALPVIALLGVAAAVIGDGDGIGALSGARAAGRASVTVASCVISPP